MGAVEFFAVLAGVGGWAWWNIHRRRVPPPWQRRQLRMRVPIPPHVRRLVYARDGFRCRWCGSPFDLQVDHMHPFSRGGSNDLGNLQTLCSRCNRFKGAAVLRTPWVAPWISGERIA